MAIGILQGEQINFGQHLRKHLRKQFGSNTAAGNIIKDKDERMDIGKGNKATILWGGNLKQSSEHSASHTKMYRKT